MHYTVSNQEDTATVELSGPITFNDSPQFRSLADMAEGCTAHAIKLDFSKVDFIDSAGLGMLLMLRETCLRRHLQLLLFAARGQVEKVFKITKFDQLFTLQGVDLMLEMIDATRLHNSLILVVDDIEVNRRVLAHSLNGHGYTKIALAADGLQALQMTRDLKPDLVILDLMMPAMDGFAYCRTIRQDKYFDTMPIIVQTAIDGMENKLKAFKSGASDYICKPVDAGELAARTQVHLNQRFLMEDLREYRTRISNELDIARVMQNRLLPDEKEIELYEHVYNLKIANEFRTSSTLGGDCWGMRPMADQGIAVFMFDFSGHGVSAALNVFRMHTLMHECQNAAGDPGQFLETLSHRLRPLLGKDEFASMFYGIIDVEDACLYYATAAVPAAYIFSGNGTLALNGAGFPLGILDNVTYDTQQAALPPESLLLFFSDGVVNSKLDDGSLLQESDIQRDVGKMLVTSPENPATAAVELIRRRLYVNTPHPLEDDVTLSAYWRCPQPY